MKPLNRKQKEHVAALTKRFEYVTANRPERPSEPDYVPGEAQALAWVIAVLAGADTPAEVRIEMIERQMQQVVTRLGRVEGALLEEAEER